MVSKKPRIVIIGAGIAGLIAANKLYTSTSTNQLFELCVVEGGSRIGGRINSSEFCGDRIELGATWIHGIEGSPIHRIAEERSLLSSDQPWECMDGMPSHPVIIAEGGHQLTASHVHPISTLFKNLMRSLQGKPVDDGIVSSCESGNVSVGSFLRKGLEAYWGTVGNDVKDVETVGNWESRSLEEAVFTMHENTQRCYSAVDDLSTLDFAGEEEYDVFPGEEITIARGYSSVVESVASVLPPGMIQLGREVAKIEWRVCDEVQDDSRPVKLHFCDGSTLSADHVIITVSLGVLKRGISHGCDMFDPPLPSSKIGAISRLGFGVVDKVFLQLGESHDYKFPFIQMVFHQPDSELRNTKIPHWIRKTSLFYPIYNNSRVMLSWFVGKEAIEIESLSDDEIIDVFSTTSSDFLPVEIKQEMKQRCHKTCNGLSENCGEKCMQLSFEKVLRTHWGSNPLFLGSYSYIAVGSNGDDMDTLSEPLPPDSLQILFVGEGTHRRHYGTTHAAFISGLREANRLLQHYNIL